MEALNVAEMKKTCATINAFGAQNAKPVEIKLKDDKGDPWVLRFHFSFNRTNIRPTDVKIRSSYINTDIKGFQFDERTSDKYFNPRNWKEPADALHWIDEPSNTIAISIENKKNAFYLTAYHPKMLRTYYEKKNPDGTATYTPGGSTYMSYGTPEAYAAIPEGQSAVEIQNTHQLMNYQIGYGRKINLMDSKKAGQINYVVRVDVGLTTGEARSIYVKPGEYWVDHREKPSVQGVNGSLGHRLEYTKGRFGAFIEQKYTKADIKHEFFDGTAEYKLDYSNIAFGVNINVLTLNKKDKDKLKAENAKNKIK